jgi:hypothetical protein
MTETPLQTSVPTRNDAHTDDPTTVWAPPVDSDGPPKPLLGAAAAGVLGGAALLVALQVRRRRQERARAAIRQRIRRAAVLAGSQVALFGLRVARPIARHSDVTSELAAGVVNGVFRALAQRGQKALPSPPVARRGLVLHR